MFTKDGEDDSEKRPTDPEDAKHPYNRAERWVSACDTVAQLYVDVRYDPAKELAGDRFTFSFPVGSERNEPYNVGFEPYNGSDLEKKIADYDRKFAEATQYNEADYKAYNELKAEYDHQMHEWEKASYELEITEGE